MDKPWWYRKSARTGEVSKNVTYFHASHYRSSMKNKRNYFSTIRTFYLGQKNIGDLPSKLIISDSNEKEPGYKKMRTKQRWVDILT